LSAGLLALCVPLRGPAASAPALPYDESADARVDLNRALQRAHAEHKHVLVVFGANWCKDCRELAQKMAGGALASHVAERYVVTKVDVARFDKNLDLARQLGDPIRKGIPAVAVLRADGTLVKATTGGELADARHMGDDEVLRVFEGLGAAAR
jgi:thioredoxin-like negative regulator of GroEL